MIPKKSNTEGKSNTEEKSNAEGSILDYSHHSSVKDFQLAISDVLRDDIVHGVKNSDCFSLMFDESTDVSVSQNLIIYIRYLSVDKVSARVEPTTSFLAIRALFRANAESITSEILDVLRERQIPLDKLIGVATDGAAVMTGKKSGVIQRLKEIQPDIVATHCIAHRLALSCGGAADKIPYLVKFQGLLNDIFKYYRNSGKNSASLKAIQSIVEQASKCKKFKEVFHTRWLSFDGALQALLQNYNSLVSLFLEESSGKALCLHKPITSYKFLYVAHYLADVMDHLSRLSKMYQRSDLDFTDVNLLLEATIETIRELKETKTGAMLRKFVYSVPTTPTEDDDGLCTFQFGPHTVRDGVQQRKEALSACDSFTDLVIQNLKQRFTATDDATTLTSLTRLFNPAIRVDNKENDMKKVSAYLRQDDNMEEMKSFMRFVEKKRENGHQTLQTTKDVAQYGAKHEEQYPNIAQAARRLLVSPVSTVDCERGFSRQNLIKTAIRNRIGIDNLENLMMISIEGPDRRKFNFTRAFSKWASKCERKILQ